MATNELRADLKLHGDQQFKRGLKDVGDSADRAGDQLEGMAKDADLLAKQAAEAEAEVKRLTHTLAETGDWDLAKSIRKHSRKQKFFEGLQKDLAKEIEEAIEQAASEASGGAVDAGMDLGEGLVEGLVKSLKTVGKPELIAAAVVIGATMLPFLGGVLASAVLGGVGTGGIVGGFALAAQDQRVKDAATSLGETALTAFSRSAEPFIAPAIEALDLLERAAVDVAGTIGPAFKGLAPVLLPLTQGIVGLVEEMLPGLIKGFEAAKPVIRAIANELPDIGRALGDFVAIIGEDTDGAVMAFAALSDIIQGTLRQTAALILGLSKAYEWSVHAAEAVSGVMVDILGWVPLVGALLGKGNDWANEILASLPKAGDASKDFAGDLSGIADAAADAEAELLAMKNAMDAAFGKTMDLHQATIAYERAVDELSKSVQENGRSLDARDEKGRANRGAILDEIQAIKDLRDANIENGMAVTDADAVYDRQIETLRANATQLFKNKAAVDAIINAFDSLPKDIELELRVKGLKGVIEQINALSKLLGGKAAATASLEGSYVSGRAHGGPVMPGQTYVVGENGPEVLQMGSQGGTVYNASQTAAMMSGSSGGGSRPPATVSRTSSGDQVMDALLQALWPHIIRQLRIDGVPVSTVGA